MRVKKTLTKADIHLALYRKIGYSKGACRELVDSVFEVIKNRLCSHHNIKISGFGNFVLQDKKARKGRNPQTGKAITIKARRRVVFQVSPVLKRQVLEKQSR